MRKTIALSFVFLLVAATLAAADGASIYKSKCAMCHGPDGKKVNKAMNIQDLTSADVQSKTDEQLIEVTTNGKAKMPAYKGKLTPEEIKAVVAHLRALAK